MSKLKKSDTKPSKKSVLLHTSKKKLLKLKKPKRLKRTVKNILEAKYDEYGNGSIENNIMEGEADSGEDSELDEEVLAVKHKKDLEKLKKTDPEFYKFLLENDKQLLQFNLSDEDVEIDDDNELETAHKPNENLEVASDESDFEDEDKQTGDADSRIITLKMIKNWQSTLQKEKSNKVIIEVTQAFHAALLRISSNEEQENEGVHYKVEGSSVFNAVIQLCVMDLGPAMRRFLGLQSGCKQPPHKCKKFSKLKGVLKLYFTDLYKLLIGVTSSNIQTILLKHLHYMSPMLSSYGNITKSILKKLISLWGSADDAVRVLAFFCILRITVNQLSSTLDTTLKTMYMTYVKNSKFVSVNSLPSINFMRRSLVEIFTLDLNLTYSHAFLYIRQLAIHLRNAITANKKENIQAVYNWQYINSLRLWGNLLSATQNKQLMQQLVYPFVQVCLGTLKLVPTAQYYPLRFHVVQILMDFSKDTGVFIPVLPFLLEVLTSYDFNKKHQKLSMKPMHFTCLLRLSKSQLQENGFKDAVIDIIYEQLLEYMASQSYTMAFPDLSLFCILQIKQFLKKCKSTNYIRKMKQVLEKIEQNSKFIEEERSKVNFNLTELKQIEGWEAQIKVKGTPLSIYYESWSKMKNIKMKKELTNNDQIADYKLPTVKKLKKIETKPSGPVELFPSDSEESENELDRKPRRGKRGGKGKNIRIDVDCEKIVDNGEKDIVEDLNADDW